MYWSPIPSVSCFLSCAHRYEQQRSKAIGPRLNIVIIAFLLQSPPCFFSDCQAGGEQRVEGEQSEQDDQCGGGEASEGAEHVESGEAEKKREEEAEQDETWQEQVLNIGIFMGLLFFS